MLTTTSTICDRISRLIRLAVEGTKMIKELDTVVLSRDLPEHGLKQGDIGAIVHCYKEGEAFEVEFISGHGHTLVVATLKSQDVRLMEDKEILHVRKLEAA